jgi:hypothetical protein
MYTFKYNINLYKFNKIFSFNLNLNYNIITLIVGFRFFIFKLPSIFFFKANDNNYKFLFLNKFKYIAFLKHLFNFYNKFFCFYYFNLKLKGLGYRVFQLSKNLIKIFFNRSNFFYLHIPKCILLKYRTRRFFFLSTDFNILKVTILHLLLLKEFIIYRLNGIYYTRQIILIKPGKNKYR